MTPDPLLSGDTDALVDLSIDHDLEGVEIEESNDSE